MANTENIGTFFDENKTLFKQYFETRLDIYRLMFIRIFSKFAGYFLWIIISLFLVFLVIIFLGLVTGFWLSEVTGSYIAGFGLATLAITLFTIAVALLRRVLFINPIIRRLVKNAVVEGEPLNVHN